MAELLYINDRLIDLGNSSVTRTLQINDFGEAKNRQANYSNQIKAPFTPENIAAFDFLGVAGSTSNAPYTTNNIKYYDDGIELISEGTAVISKTSDVFNIVIYDGNTTLTTLLGNDTLADLDFSAYNHNLGVATYLNNQTNTNGYVYALNKDGTTPQSVNLNTTSPLFYIHTLFDMIFTQKGYSVSGDVFAESDYLSRVTTVNSGFEQNYNEVIVNEKDVNVSYNQEQIFPEASRMIFLVTSHTAVGSGIFVHSISNSIGGGGAGINIIQGTSASLDIRVNSNLVGQEFFSSNGSISDLVFEANNGDIIEIEVSLTPDNIASNYYGEITINSDVLLDLNNSYYPINFEDIIGTVKQIDFVKEIMQRFSLSFDKVKHENEFRFIKSDDLLSDFDGADNWTGKYSRFIDEVYVSGYAQKNNITYQYDESEDVFADGSFDITNVNLKEESNLFSSLFKASYQNGTEYFMEHWKFSDKDDVYTPNEDGLRIFKLNQSVEEIFLALNHNGSPATVTRTFSSITFDTLGYQTEIDNNYTDFIAMLNEYKKVQIEVDLSLIDVYDLDFFKLKFFEQLGGYYYLNKVQNFKKDRVTKIEIIKVPV